MITSAQCIVMKRIVTTEVSNLSRPIDEGGGEAEGEEKEKEKER